MRTEFLKNLGLEQDAIDAIMAENGKDVNKVRTKLDAATEELDALRAQVSPKDSHIKELEAQVAKMNDLQAKYDALVVSSESAKTNYETEIAGLKRDSLIDGKLRDPGAKNLKAVKALLDITNENWDEQIATLKASEDSAFLFASGEATSPTPPTGAKPASSGGNPKPKEISWHEAIANAISAQKGAK